MTNMIPHPPQKLKPFRQREPPGEGQGLSFTRRIRERGARKPFAREDGHGRTNKGYYEAHEAPSISREGKKNQHLLRRKGKRGSFLPDISSEGHSDDKEGRINHRCKNWESSFIKGVSA